MEFCEIKRIIKEIDTSGRINKIDLEGPKIILYTDDVGYFVDHDDEIKNYATSLKKRVVIRSSPNKILDEEDARRIITEIIPAEAEITSILFDPYFEMVYIEAEKLGLVIGKKGSTLNEILKRTGWEPKMLRKVPIDSRTINSIRKMVIDCSEERQKILKAVGKRIYRKPNSSCDWVRLTPLGGGRQVGRSSFLVQTPESNIMIDCGIDAAASGNNRFPDLRASELAVDKLDAIIISHAHLDHCGFLPYLYKYQYEGPIYCTEPTRDLMTLLQIDAIDVGLKDENELPFTSNEIKKIVKHTIPLEYGEVVDITPDTRLTLYNAGHIIGSSVVHLHLGDGLHNIVYTGDIKFGDTRLLEAGNYEFLRAETLVMESTYGGRHDIQPKRYEAEEALTRYIKSTIDKGGKVLIPVFSVGRSQEVMMVLENRFWRGDLSGFPVYLDGMIWEATAIHTAYPEYLKDNIKQRIFSGNNPFLAESFYKVNSRSERKEIINGDKPSVILATSGMMTGGPSIEYFKNLCEDEKNTLLFVGYQAEGSLGRRLQNGMKTMVVEGARGRTKELNINMSVKTVDGFSGHADRRQILGYCKKIHPRPNRVILVHGEKEKAKNLSTALEEMFGFDVFIPQNLDTLRLA